MGEGGSVLLINATPYAWRVVSSSQTEMNSWSFTDVPARSYYSSYVEWSADIFVTSKASVNYTLVGTDNYFQIKATAPSKNFNIAASLDHIAAYDHAQGTSVNLGWIHDGSVPFTLVGSNGNFWLNNVPPAWMHSMLPTIGSQPLRHICIPGSHDSGMSELNAHTALIVAGNVLTQTQNIGGQLANGARYFDIRPVIADGQYTAGHYDDTNVDGVGWQGGNGQSFDEIIAQINAFTASNPELIILNLSHDLDSDAANRDYSSFTQAQWNALFDQLLTINHLFVAPNPNTVDLSLLTLDTFIGNGQAAVVIICQFGPGLTLGDYNNKGFYEYGAYNIYNAYSNVDSISTMSSDQVNKLKQQRASPDAPPFLFSWTLTQSVSDMAELKSIISLAESALPSLTSALIANINPETYPNVVYIDNFADQTATILSAAVNYFVVSGTSSRDYDESDLREIRRKRAFKNIR